VAWRYIHQVLTPCLGREQVQRSLAAALADARWISVVGPPGSGKTLLARHVADQHADATWVDARSLRTLDALLARALTALDS
jgi:MoxR-like ATPase